MPSASLRLAASLATCAGVSPWFFAKLMRSSRPRTFSPGSLMLMLFERQLHDGGLIVGVVNLEIARQAEAWGFTAQKPRGEGMKCADPGIVKRESLADQQVADAFLHLPGGLIRERHRKNRAAGNALIDQVGDAIRDGARFARPGAGQNQYRSFNGCCSFALPGIQFVKECHDGEWARLKYNILSDAEWFGKFRFGDVRERQSRVPYYLPRLGQVGAGGCVQAPSCQVPAAAIPRLCSPTCLLPRCSAAVPAEGHAVPADMPGCYK